MASTCLGFASAMNTGADIRRRWNRFSKDDSSGASDHAHTVEWKGALAFANIGFAGEAVCGSKWAKKHRPTLLETFAEPTQQNPAVRNVSPLTKMESVHNGRVIERFEIVGAP